MVSPFAACCHAAPTCLAWEDKVARTRLPDGRTMRLRFRMNPPPAFVGQEAAAEEALAAPGLVKDLRATEVNTETLRLTYYGSVGQGPIALPDLLPAGPFAGDRPEEPEPVALDDAEADRLERMYTVDYSLLPIPQCWPQTAVSVPAEISSLIV